MELFKMSVNAIHKTKFSVFFEFYGKQDLE